MPSKMASLSRVRLRSTAAARTFSLKGGMSSSASQLSPVLAHKNPMRLLSLPHSDSKQNRALRWEDFEKAHETYIALSAHKQA